VGWFFQFGTVHVDNATGQELRVQLDGQEWMSCRAGSRSVSGLRPGLRHLRVLGRDGRLLDERTVRVERQGVYVLNLLGAQVYHRGTVDYGGFSFGDRQPTEIREPWFEAKVDYLFQSPPSSITVSTRRGELAMASKSFLLRGLAPAKSR
jgi:hypothetical protein